MFRARVFLSLLLAVVLGVVLGCGSEQRDPKQSLNEKEQQQLKELQQQREQEWGGSKKRK